MPEAAQRDIAIERRHLPQGAEIRRITWTRDSNALVLACRGADAVLTDYVPFTREVLSRLAGPRLISVAATGWDCVDVDAALDAGISVAAAGEYCTEEVADHTLALMLAMNRRLRDYDRQVQRERSWRWDEVSGTRRLKGQTLGLVGCGRIGSAVARRAAAFGLRVIAFDPGLEADAGSRAGVEFVSLETLLSESDIISLHCTLGPGNAGLLGAEAFAAMRRRPLLVNVSRGELIVERDLTAALDAGQVSGAALDVLVDEPPDLDGHPLLGRDNVLLTPHIAFYSESALRNLQRISADNIRHFLEGRPGEVNRLIVDARARQTAG